MSVRKAVCRQRKDCEGRRRTKQRKEMCCHVGVPTEVNIQFQAHSSLNPLNAELNPICYLLALLGAHHFLHVSRIRVESLTLRLLMSYIYGAPILDVSRSHTTTHHVGRTPLDE